LSSSCAEEEEEEEEEEDDDECQRRTLFLHAAIMCIIQPKATYFLHYFKTSHVQKAKESKVIRYTRVGKEALN